MRIHLSFSVEIWTGFRYELRATIALQASEVMPMELDPDSVKMGFWVDRWLQSLRTAGVKPRELQRYAERLAEALTTPDTDLELIDTFYAFIEEDS